MSIVCAICGKEQSSWIQDYPLSKELADVRICVACNEHLHNMITTKEDEVFDYEKSYFLNYLTSFTIPERITGYFNTAFSLKSQIASDNKSIEAALNDEISASLLKMNEQRKEAKSKILVSTGYDLQGYKITKYIDVIFAEKITGIGFKTNLKAFGDIFASLTGDEMHAISDRINELKISIIDLLKEEALKLGANAIIGIDFETTIPGAGIMMSISGTAVYVERD